MGALLLCMCLFFISCSCVKTQDCPVEVSQQISQNNVFVNGLHLSKETGSGNSIPSVRATWEVRYPECFSSLCISFKDAGAGGSVIVTRCLHDDEIAANEWVESGLDCNVHVGAELTLTSDMHTVSEETNDRVYTGGDLSRVPEVPPGNVMAVQSPDDPQRILLSWEELECLQTNAPTTYLIEYGRQDNIGGVRTLSRRGLRVRSSVTSSTAGLGILDQNVVYFFRVAAENANGAGPYSEDVLAIASITFVGPVTLAPPTPPPTSLPTTPPTINPPVTLPTMNPPTLPPPTNPLATSVPPTTPVPPTIPVSSITTPVSTVSSSQPATLIPHTDPPAATSDSLSVTTPTSIVHRPTNSTSPTSNHPTLPQTTDHSTTDAEFKPSQPAVSRTNSAAVAVPVILLLVLLITVLSLVLLFILWRHKSDMKTHRYNVRAMDDTLMEINRDSALLNFDISVPQTNGFPDELKGNGHDSSSAVEPTLTSYRNIVYVDEGEEVTLQVDFKGYPHPTITWFFDGLRLDEYKSEGREMTEEGSLHIPKVLRDHAGTYDFVVSNPSGCVEGCTRLIVYLKDRKMSRSFGQTRICSNPVKQEVFGEHVAKCHKNSDSGFSEEFENLSSGETGQKALVGRSANNRHFNRFRTIICYDDNRVVLDSVHRHPECQDYINASYIDGYVRAKKFIATQAPLSHTLVDFWRMVWQEKVQTIVMLNSAAEGKLKKSEIYWPEVGSREYGPFMITLVECQVFADYTIRTMQLVASRDIRLSLSSRNVRKVTQFHFTAWPDQGVPDFAGPFLVFQRRIKSQHKPTKGPLLIHCDGGVGRTGCFLATDIALAQVARESVIDVAGIVYQLRNQRMKMIQSQHQYAFIHDAVLESLVCGNTQVPASSMKKAMTRLTKKSITTDRNGFETQFHVLNQVSPKPLDIARNTALAYADKNRTSDFLPPDKWRVVLKSQSLKGTYVHASYANGYKQKRGFIIAQAPMSNTTEEFWKMIYEKDVAVIVMLSELYENEKEVCYQYWPNSDSTGIDGEAHGEHIIYTLETKRQDSFIVRKLGITGPNTANMRKVTHFMLTDWTASGFCSDPKAVMKMIDQLLIAQRRTGNKPIVMHGIDSVSRCGVFCCLLSCIEHCKTESMVDVFQTVKALRIQKPGSVQTVEQYRTIYELVLLFLNSFTLYSNFK